MSAAPLGANRLALAAVLAYGGVAAQEWFRTAVLGGADVAMAPMRTPAHVQWLRDGTLALPFVVALVFLAARRYGAARSSENPNAAIASFFAALMGAGYLLQQTFPEAGHAAGSPPHGTYSLSLLQDTMILMLVAGVYALLVTSVFGMGERLLNSRFDRLPAVPRSLRVIWPIVVVLAVTPVVALTGGGKAVAQTRFPDRAIHPRNTLTMIARVLPDSTFGYVAVGYGELGVRPIIEMTEGETLTITLKNEIHTAVSLHVHGVQYRLNSDGTRHSGSFVPPNETRTYVWKAGPGTSGYWHYHDHVMGDDEGTLGIRNGLYGGLIVRKPGELRPSKTFMLVFHDWTVNGFAYPATPTPVAREGEVVEFIVVSYMDQLHTFHLHAHRWLIPPRPVDPDRTLPENAGSAHEDNHILAPGDSFGFITVAGEGVGPGKWMYHCHVQSHSAMMMGFFDVQPRR